MQTIYAYWQEHFVGGADANARKGSWAAFGEGMRSCIGFRFASMEARITLFYLLKSYSFRLADSNKPLAVTSDTYPPTLRPLEGAHLAISSRH